MRTRYQRQCLISGASACVGDCALDETRPESGRGIPFACKMVCKLQTPITNPDKRGLHGKPRLAAGEAADGGGRHGESD